MASRRPASPDHRPLAAVAAAAAVAGGALAFGLAWFARVGLLSLAFGAAATACSLALLAALSRRTRWLPLMLGYAFAFVVLSWPVLYLVMGYIRYLLTGKSLGD